MKQIYLILSIIFFSISASAGVGTYEYYVQANNNGSTTGYADYGGFPSFNTANLGAVNNTSLTLQYPVLRTWEDNGDMVLAATFYYRVYKTGTTPGSFTSVALSNPNGKSGNNREWIGPTGIDLLAGITGPGDYVVEMYYHAATNAGNLFRSNSGSNYKANFTVNSVLPVQLISFIAKAQDNNVVLLWQTAMEESNAGFNIQRSIDGVRFDNIGFVKGAGNGTQLNKYAYADNAPLSGTSFYRLQQVDVNGKTSYSSIEKVNYLSFSISVSPNPVMNVMTIKGMYAGDGVQVRTVAGKMVYKNNNQTVNTIDISSWKPGTYFITVSHNGESKTTKFIKL